MSANNTITVTLDVNSQAAAQKIEQLKKRAESYKDALAYANNVGNKAEVARLRKGLQATNRELRTMESSLRSAEKVLASLDKATPKELRSTLSYYTKELNNVERGSEAWKDHVEQIRKIKNELKNVNEELKPQGSLLERAGAAFRKYAGMLTAGAASLTGLVAAGRKAVEMYSELDTALADTQKFTGMSRKETTDLNEELKKIDTRTSIAGLHQLAQEAGRLGKTSKEDILGFVRAADVINVALDDLGEGATLTLSKITGVFGDEERLGTEQSLLAVGSVVNDLSQSCAASAPYVTEFTSQMAGVGSQAEMTVPQIMAYGAVLDATNQNVEASATSLQTVVMKMLQDPAKLATALGMDVKAFSETVKTDVNAALLMLLENLRKFGNMQGMAPLFDSMGLDGARTVSTLSALAGQLDMVKQKQQEAAASYALANSVVKESNVQQSSYEAQLDKSRKRLAEIAVALGERLAPVMAGFYSSAGTMLETISTIVSWLFQHKTAVLTLTASIVAYTAVSKAELAVATLRSALLRAQNLLMAAHTKAVILMKVAYLALTGNMKAANRAMLVFNATARKNIFGLIAAALAAVIGLIIRFVENMQSAKEKVKAMREEMANFKKEVRDTSQAAADFAKAEIAQLKTLYAAATDEARAKEERLKAAKRLIGLYPEYFKNMSAEDILLGRAKKQYEDIAEAVIKVARAKAAATKIEENEGKLLDLEAELEEKQKRYDTASEEVGKWRAAKDRENTPAHMQRVWTKGYEEAVESWSAINGEMRMTLWKIRELKVANDWLRKKTDTTDEETGSETRDYIPNPESPESGDGKAHRFAREENLAEQQRRINEVEYSIGAKDYQAYCDRLNAIDEELLKKKLARNDLTEKERKALQSELDKKNKDEASASDKQVKTLIEKEKAAYEDAYQERLNLLKKMRADGKLTEEAYNNQCRLAELGYLSNLRDIYRQETENELKYLRQGYNQRIFMLDTALMNGMITEQEYSARRLQAEEEFQQSASRIAEKYAKERSETEEKIDEKLLADKLRRRKDFEQRIKRFEQEWMKNPEQKLSDIKDAQSEIEYMRDNGVIDEETADFKIAALDLQADALERADKLLNNGAESSARFSQAVADLNEQLAKGEISQEKFDKKKEDITRDFVSDALGDNLVGDIYRMGDAWMDVVDTIKSGGEGIGEIMGKAVVSTVAVIQEASQMATQFVQANAQIAEEAVKKHYDAEISAAEGNSYKVTKLEKERDEKIAKVKKQASKKQFAMQVVTAIAQTAQSVISAANAGFQAGWPLAMVMVPLLTGMATALGAAQIALIKKQQTAAAATGYADGGFTKPGHRDEPAGIVHAGEWVASQKLLVSPVARPLIDALDYAQRTNTIGSLRMTDISTVHPKTNGINRSDNVHIELALKEMQAVVAKLNKRLSEPFVTVNTVSGDAGIKQAQDDYQKMIKNKTPKRKWK